MDLAFSNYADRFASSCKGAGWRTLVDRSLRLHLKPVLGSKPLPKITRPDIVTVFDRRPDEQIANRRNVVAVLRRLFRWAASRGDIQSSPMEGMETPPPVRARNRWLRDSELASVWTHMAACHRCCGPIVRLPIITGQRREEVMGLQWEELDRNACEWSLPAERTKNDEPNTVPLNALAITELDNVARGEKWPRRGRVFPTSTGAGFTAYSKGKAKLDQRLAEDAEGPILAWRLHDLRRTLATGFQRLGVRFEVTEAVLNHAGGSRSGVAGIYQRHDWRDEKRGALRDWNDHVVDLLRSK